MSIWKKNKTKYKARTGSPFSRKDAQEIGETIEGLRDKKGHVTSEDIVLHAEDENSILNKYFEWDDDEASRLFRLHQARLIINHIVEIVVIGSEKVNQRSFFSVETKDNKKVYVTVKQAIKEEGYRKQLLNRAINQLENLTVTLRMFKEAE